ncbi:MAG: biopolymer transporter ExbD [Spirochaetales bacterium]|nr:biopolymer transporter ExbD [Spirochaetales bacterium]
MKLNRTTLIPTMPDSADIAYLLLIFIIIMSLIGTDNISGLKLPSASSEERAPRQAERLIVKESSFIVGNTECADTAELESIIRNVPVDNGVMIIADKNCPAARIKSVLRVLEKCGKGKVGFAVE